MRYERGKISVRQLILIFLLAIYSPIVRLSPALTAKFAKQAGWLCPPVASLGFILLVYFIQYAFKKNNCQNLMEVFEKSIGKIATKCVGMIYLFWLLILLALYVRYYAARLASSILPGTDIPILSVILLIVVFVGVRGGIEPFARFSELFFTIFIVIFIILFALSIPFIDIYNLFPVTHLDVIPVLKGTYPVFGLWGYFTYIFFLGEFVTDKENIGHIGKQATIFNAVRGVMLMSMTIGTLGYSIMERSNLPFFIAIKSISLFDTIERVESILAASWVVADYVIITLFILMIQAIMKHLFSLSDLMPFSSPIILFSFIFSLYLAISSFELGQFSLKIGLAINILTCYILPFIIIGIGKLRKTI